MDCPAEDSAVEFPKRVDDTVESHDTHIKTITIDGAELDTCNESSNTKKLLHLVSRILSCSSKVRDSLTKHLNRRI